ncbi:hypothetical protein [Streptomyces sp. bgisy084]
MPPTSHQTGLWSFRDGPWFGALPTFTAAATATDRLRPSSHFAPMVV